MFWPFAARECFKRFDGKQEQHNLMAEAYLVLAAAVAKSVGIYAAPKL